MKITIYELLGMIKDGKAPKKIKYDGNLWEFNKDFNQYQTKKGGGNIWNGYNFNILNDEVEILEEENKIPEKLKIEQNGQTYNNFYIVNQNGTKCYLTKHSKMIVETLNQVIDYLKSKGDE